MSKSLSLLIVIVALGFIVGAVAEKANMSPTKLLNTATHVVTGDVAAIYQRTVDAQDWQYTHYLIEIRAKECEKGEGIDPGDLVYARCWTRKWIGVGTMPPSTRGHRGIPSEGDVVRVYLARNAYDGFSRDNHDGGFNVIGANGFVKLEPSTGE